MLTISSSKSASPSGQILEHLLRHGPASIKDIEGALGVTATAVRQQLSNLAAEGLVTMSKERRGVGRPRNVYTPTPRAHNLFACHSDEFTLLLISELVATDGDEKLRYLLDRMGEKMAHQYGDQLKGRVIGDRVRELSTLLDQRGVMSGVEMGANGDVIILHEYNCPYHELAATHRDVCEMERSVFEKVLGTEVTLSNCIHDGSHSCQFVISESSLVETGDTTLTDRNLNGESRDLPSQ
ncbi:MAG: MarR family transcriptional regulator [Chloroflexota bacterium]|nr:MarR family transcriptional regulator [Chloroflexota bacterium]